MQVERADMWFVLRARLGFGGALMDLHRAVVARGVVRGGAQNGRPDQRKRQHADHGHPADDSERLARRSRR
jgi:hypothetical protein